MTGQLPRARQASAACVPVSATRPRSSTTIRSACSIVESRCATMGVFAPLVGVVGAMQAAEALKVVAGVGRTLAGRLLLYDALAAQWRELRVPRDPRCPVCAQR